MVRLLWRLPGGTKGLAAGATISALVFAFCSLMGNADRFETISFSITGGVQAKADRQSKKCR
jgi:hypothetical protein